MVVNRNRQGALGVFLTDAIKIQLRFNLCWAWHLQGLVGFLRLQMQLFIDDVFADNDAMIANVHPRALDQFLDFGVGLSAEATET